MKTSQVVKIGFFHGSLPKFSSYIVTQEKLAQYLPKENAPLIQRATLLADYLVKFSKEFDDASFILTNDLPNGAFAGMKKLLIRSEIDIAFQTFAVIVEDTETVDFSYPLKFHRFTYMTQKPEYIPQMFDLFHAFSTPIWIAIILLLIAMLLIYYATFKWKYSFERIFLHVFGVFLKQCSILKPSSMAENLLVYSFVIGSMFLVLFYESTILSFFSIPPITKINDVSQLATAVARGEYHCIAPKGMGIGKLLAESKRRDIRIIEGDLKRNNLTDEDLVQFIFNATKKQNLAFLANAELIEIYKTETKFVSEDSFFEMMAAMMIRKDFCCKKLIDTFVHRIMASGLYLKGTSDSYFLRRLPFQLRNSQKQISERKLTLVHFAPAFMFLLVGYVISFMALICELLLNRNVVGKCLIINKKKKKRNRTLPKTRTEKTGESKFCSC